MFSTLKYVIAPTLDLFRQTWNGKYLGGFVVHSKSFDGIRGNFPIGFLLWKTDMKAKQKYLLLKLLPRLLIKMCAQLVKRPYGIFLTINY